MHSATSSIDASAATVPELLARIDHLSAELHRFRVVAQSSTDVVSTADNTGVLTWIADSVTDVLGWSPEDMIGRPLRDFVHPDDFPLLVADLPSLQLGEAPRAELRIRCKDGQWHWISFMRKQIFDAHGVPLYRVGGWRDIADEREVRDALAASHELMRATLDSMLDPHILLQAVRNSDGEIVDFAFADANPAAAVFHQIEREQLVGSRFLGHHPAARTTSLFSDYVAVVETGKCLVRDSYEFPLDLLNGELRHFDIRGVKIRDGLSLTWRDVTSRVQESRQLERLAHYDGLTGAMNHSEALRRLGAALRDERQPGEYLAVLFCDTDLFKHINDTHGHAAGDQVLVELTRRISGAVRREDLVARMGGDEFLVVLNDVHSLEEAMDIAEKVRTTVLDPISLPDRELHTTLSIGVALATRDENLDRLLERADIAMYQAKRAGRNRVHAK